MRNTLAGAILGVAIGISSQAFAHTDLVKSIPAADSTVPTPKSIILTFSEKVAPAFIGFALTSDGGATMPLSTAISADGKVITCTPKKSLLLGRYKLAWHAAAADGHRTDGIVSFKVK